MTLKLIPVIVLEEVGPHGRHKWVCCQTILKLMVIGNLMHMNVTFRDKINIAKQMMQLPSNC